MTLSTTVHIAALGDTSEVFKRSVCRVVAHVHGMEATARGERDGERGRVREKRGREGEGGGGVVVVVGDGDK